MVENLGQESAAILTQDEREANIAAIKKTMLVIESPRMGSQELIRSPLIVTRAPYDAAAA